MVSNGSGIGEGNVILTLEDGEELILKPTWGAAQAISRNFGGIASAVERVVRMDFDVTMQVLMFGLGYLNNKKPPPDLQERIWRSGFTDDTGAVAEKAVEYLHVLANGGKPRADKSAEPVGEGENPSMRTSTGPS